MMMSPRSLLLLVLSASSIMAGGSVTEVTCDECRAAARDFTLYLLSDQSLTQQTEILQRQVCPQVSGNWGEMVRMSALLQNPDSDLARMCRDFLQDWYGAMAECIYTNIFLDQVGCYHHQLTVTWCDPGPVRPAGALLPLQPLPVSPRLGVSGVQEHAGPHSRVPRPGQR